jgi:acetyltransferase-like isoleucine patch superfamily enzyme
MKKNPGKNYKIYPNVKIGKNAKIGDFVIIGLPVKGPKASKTVIGDNAVIRSHTVIYAGNIIGDNFQTGHNVLIREDNKIGCNVSIGSGSNIEHHLEINDGVRIHSHVFIPEFTVLEKKAWIGPSVVMTNAPHPCCPKAKECLRGPRIKKGARIGANSTILPAVEIGQEALVGAGSVVVSDVAPQTVVVGNPAKKVKNIGDLKCRYGLVESPYGSSRKKQDKHEKLIIN